MKDDTDEISNPNSIPPIVAIAAVTYELYTFGNLMVPLIAHTSYVHYFVFYSLFIPLGTQSTLSVMRGPLFLSTLSFSAASSLHTSLPRFVQIPAAGNVTCPQAARTAIDPQTWGCKLDMTRRRGVILNGLLFHGPLAQHI